MAGGDGVSARFFKFSERRADNYVDLGRRADRWKPSLPGRTNFGDVLGLRGARRMRGQARRRRGKSVSKVETFSPIER